MAAVPDQGLVLSFCLLSFLGDHRTAKTTVTVKIKELFALHTIPSLTFSKCIIS